MPYLLPDVWHRLLILFPLCMDCNGYSCYFPCLLCKNFSISSFLYLRLPLGASCIAGSVRSRSQRLSVSVDTPRIRETSVISISFISGSFFIFFSFNYLSIPKYF